MKRFTYLCLVCTLAISPAAPAATLRTVVLSGQQVPGAPDGTVFREFYEPPVLNDAGQTAFLGSSTAGRGVLSEGSGSLEFVAAVGRQAPGMPDGVIFNFLWRIVINDAGMTAFSAQVIEPGSGPAINGIWSSGPGGSALIARDGEQAAGMPAGVNYSFVHPYTFLISDAGQVAFQSNFSGGDMGFPNSQGIWAQRHGNLELVARQGDHAPGTPAGVSFGGFDVNFPFSLNNLNQTAFQGVLTGSGVIGRINVGFWSEGSGSLALVARKGSQAPGMPDGTVFDPPFFSAAPALNSAGQTAFYSRVTGGGVDSTNNQGIWLDASGSLELVARTGTPAPGTPSGVTFSEFFSSSFSYISPALNDAGHIAFFATLTGAGVDATNNLGIWSGAPGSLALVVRRGERAPGTEDGIAFGSHTPADIRHLALNAAGQTAFFMPLRGSGISDSNDLGIWATDRSGALQLIAREGDLLEVAPGDFRTISNLRFVNDWDYFSTGNGDGRPSAFNNLGQIAFNASFTDGSSGIFVSNRVAVPEPSSLLLAALAAAGLLLPRRVRESLVGRGTLIFAKRHESQLGARIAG